MWLVPGGEKAMPPFRAAARAGMGLPLSAPYPGDAYLHEVQPFPAIWRVGGCNKPPMMVPMTGPPKAHRRSTEGAPVYEKSRLFS